MKVKIITILIVLLLAGCSKPAPKAQLQMTRTGHNSSHDNWKSFSFYGSELITSDWDIELTINQIEDGELTNLKSLRFSAAEDKMIIITTLLFIVLDFTIFVFTTELLFVLIELLFILFEILDLTVTCLFFPEKESLCPNT